MQANQRVKIREKYCTVWNTAFTVGGIAFESVLLMFYYIKGHNHTGVRGNLGRNCC